MKKFLSLISFILIFAVLSSCSQSSVEPQTPPEPDVDQIRSICDLATLECYYHNVATSVKKKAEGISHLGEKDRKFWIEYTGIVKIGIDMSEVDMIISDGNIVKIYVPEAKLISINIDEKEFNENSFLCEKDRVNSNPITVEDQKAAVRAAQTEMEQSVTENKGLLLSAQSRAKDLIESYVVTLGNFSGVTYQIDWVDDVSELKQSSNPTSSVSQ